MDKRSISVAMPAALLLGLLLCLMAAPTATVQAQPPLPDVHSAQTLGPGRHGHGGHRPGRLRDHASYSCARPARSVYFCYRATNTGQ